MTGSGPQARITACLAPTETEAQSLGSMELSRELAVPFSNSNLPNLPTGSRQILQSSGHNWNPV